MEIHYSEPFSFKASGRQRQKFTSESIMFEEFKEVASQILKTLTLFPFFSTAFMLTLVHFL